VPWWPRGFGSHRPVARGEAQQPVRSTSKKTTGCCRCLDHHTVAGPGHFPQNANGIAPRVSNQGTRCWLGSSIRSGPEKIFRRPPPATSAPRVTKRSRSGAPDTASRYAGNPGNGAEALEGRNGLTSMIGDVLRRAPDTTRSERLIGDYKSVRHVRAPGGVNCTRRGANGCVGRNEPLFVGRFVKRQRPPA